MNILHIHQDYPDGRPYPYTKAVSNLIEACKKVQPNDSHTVLSINRSSSPFKVSTNEFPDGISIVYWAIPLPFLYYISMKISAYIISRKLKHLKFDVIHAHKLTCEGVFAYWLAKWFAIPYVVSIRGGSDSNNFNRLSHHISFFKTIYKGATKVFWVSPWMKNTISSNFNIDDKFLENNSLLPNICQISLDYQMNSDCEHKKYITAISFHQYKRKGVIPLIQAIAQLKATGTMIYLDIYGSGERQYIDIIQGEINKYDIPELIHLKGEVKQEKLLEKMKSSKGFLMPAINETFGMSYVEAISVCCPILYVENTGIDGHLDDVFAGVKISSPQVELIRRAILDLDSNLDEYQQKLSDANNSDYLRKFTDDYVAGNYLKALQDIKLRI